MYTLKAIKTGKEYITVLSRMKTIFDSKPGSKEGNEAEVLMILISDYERLHYPVEAPTPIEAIRFRMEQLNLQQKDLAIYMGSATRVSEILRGKRPLTLTMIAALHKGLDIPLASLIQSTRKGKKSIGSLSYPLQSKISSARERKSRYRKKK